MDNEKKCWYKVHILFVVPLAIMVTMAEKRGMPFNKDVVHFFLATLFFFFLNLIIVDRRFEFWLSPLEELEGAN